MEQMLREVPRFRKNKKKRAASHYMVGPDRGQAMWTICIVELPSQRGLWRAITGWPSEDSEKEWYRRSK